jgi:putative MATE family efflux protein
MPAYKAVLKNALPAIVATLMQLVYNLADTFFIGFTRDDYQVAAVSLVFPVFMLFMSVGMIFGIGGMSVISRAYGEGRAEYAKKVSSFCMWASIAVGVPMSVVTFVCMDPLLNAMGAMAGETLEYSRNYLTIIMSGGPLILIGNTFPNILRAEGEPRKAMTGQLIGNIANIVLDPIMILGFGLGISGAAVATLIGCTLGAGYYILHFLRGKSSLSIHPRDFTMREKVLSSVVSIGIPAAMGPLFMSVSQVVMNGLMSGYGSLAVAAAGVAGKVSMIISTIALGLSQGVQPLLGFSIGAANWKRYREYLRFSLLFGTAMCALVTGLCYVFTPQIVGVFLTEPESLSNGISFAYIMQTTAFLFGAFFCFVNALQAMGAAIPSLIVNISRQGIIYIPALFILRAVLGSYGLIWAQPVADVLSLIMAVALHKMMYKRMTKRTATPLLVDESASLHASANQFPSG